MYTRIQELAKQHGYSIRSLEEKLGLSNGTIRRWELHAPSADKVATVAGFLDTTTDYLLGMTDTPTNPDAKLSGDAYALGRDFDKATPKQRALYQKLLDAARTQSNDEGE